MSVHSVIVNHLENLMRQYGCRLLFAGESGSRAWGLESPDSDYDVRCIYAHPAHWYLSIEDRRDSFETVFPEDIDISGYELRKALRLFSACSIPMNEQILNPVSYGGVPSFVKQLRTLIPVYFIKSRALLHYTSVAAQAIQHVQGLSIGIHRVFYIIRPLLACEWIEKHGSMPPTEFQKLLDADFLPLPLMNEVTEIMQRKAVTIIGSRESVQLSKDLLYWATESFQQHQETLRLLPASPAVVSLEPLNDLFRVSIDVSENESRM
ncbi:MAG: nucleotidyltransferase domain-containing protein [Planctomycetaceae bacterium]|jgi:predicted nucleotidyltransferase|nr:nucleotidyltransferase domain-containing protein [Planctomycetaceae bacterium]